MENGPFIDDLPIKMVIFHSYVSLAEGNHANHQLVVDSITILGAD
jgi:hypothetical protein